MDKINPLQKEIAESFSTGNFEFTFPYLSEKITWIIFGENEFKGKSTVVANCEQTSEYFQSIQTNFTIEDTIVANNKVVVRGRAEFIKNGEIVNLIKACDVYEFNDSEQLVKILSYCIAIDK